ncbi:MAG: GGDEF domain-containing protein [Deltaproteobacteria bacterium]|nr:GGDEF domain-containing protein [Deltaproteobacteria bacterium]
MLTEGAPELDIESLEKLRQELEKTGALSFVLEPDDNEQAPVLAFILKNLPTEKAKDILERADLTLTLSRDSLQTLETLREIVENNKKLTELSVKDPLTSLFNQRYFREQLKVEMDRAKRTERPCCLIIMDLDKFKPVNDEHGHQTGDRLLKDVAQILLETVRMVDVVVRYGGDEFAVILPDTSARNAVYLANRMCKALAEDERTKKYGVTGSLGLATYDFFDREDLETFVDHADHAMYQAKSEGGNRVSLWESDRRKARPTEVSVEEKNALSRDMG